MQPLSPLFMKHHTRLIFISTSTNEQTQEFLANPIVDIPGDLYADPSVKVHRLFQLKRGVFRSLVMPLWSGMKKYGFKGIIEGARLGYQTSHLAGDSWQQGGLVLLDQKGDVLHQHTESHPGDWSDMKEIFNTIGVDDANVDYKQAVDQWLKARKEHQQDKS